MCARVPFCIFISREEILKPAIALLSLSMLAALPNEAGAWGDDGHKVGALIAQHCLTPTAKKQLDR
jgi:hypothetical protein